MVYVKTLTATFPAREGDPVGTADTSRFDYIRGQFDAETVLYYVEYDSQRLTLAFV